MNNRIIRKVGVIGSGIMGAQIACHFANIGVQAVLLDILPSSPTDEKKERTGHGRSRGPEPHCPRESKKDKGPQSKSVVQPVLRIAHTDR